MCLVGVLSAQDVERIDQYLVGNRVSFFIGQCGAEVPEAAGRLSFCDGAGNLGVVMESLGLSGRGVLRMLPNYHDDREVYVTRGGISIYHPDGTWENIPNIAVGVRDFQGNITNEGQIETGLVDANGVLHFNITSTARRLYYTYDLTTKVITEVLPEINQGIVAFAYDPDDNYVYALGESFRDTRLYGNDRGTGTAGLVSTLDAIPESVASNINNTSFVFREGRLWLGTNQGLFIIDPADGFSAATLNAAGGQLPLDRVRDIEFAADGTVWLAQLGGNRGALVALTVGDTDTSYIEYTLPLPNNANIETYFTDLALLPGGGLTAVATNYFGYFDLDVSGAQPAWTVVDRDSMEALAINVTYVPTSIERRGDKVLYLTNDFSTGNTAAPEVLIRDAADNFTTRNDDAPGNYSFWEIDRFNYLLPDNRGGVYVYSHFDNILSYLSPTDGLASRTFSALPPVEPAVDQEGRLVYLGVDASNRSSWNLLDWPFDRPIADVTSNNIVTAYGNTVALFNRSTGEFTRTVDGVVIARDTLPGGNAYRDVFHIGVGSDGRIWLAAQDRGQGIPIFSYDPVTGDTTQFLPGRTTAPPVRVLAGPEGKMYFLAQRGLVYFDGAEYHVHTQQDYPELAAIRDGVVDTLGRFFLLSNTDGAIHEVTDLDGTPTFSTRRISSILPFLDGRGGSRLTLDADGDMWIGGVAGLFQLHDDYTAPAFRPRGNDYVLRGRVYADVNDNGRFDEGEGLPGQPVAVTVDGNTRMRLTDAEGNYAYLLREENAEYRVTLTTVDRMYYAADRQKSVNVTATDRDYTVPAFRLDVKSYNSLYFQTANKTGAWGFDRRGFDNVFTTAVTNLSTTKTFRDLDVGFVYFNQNPDSGNELPEVVDVRVTRLTPTGVPLLVNHLVIRPRDHGWSLRGLTPNQYDRETLSSSPNTVSVPDTVTTTVTIDALEPRQTVIIEIETDLFQASSSGVAIGYSPSRVDSPDLDNGGNVNDDVVVIYPEDDNGGPRPVDPFSDPNSPYVSPEETYDDPPYDDPSSVYAPSPYRTSIFSSYDPNDKLVDGGVATELNDTEVDQRWFTYTIRFENTGNFSAKDVWIVDTLDGQFLPGSFTLLDASHAAEAEYFSAEGNRLTVLRFSLEDIYLPFQDSLNDGYVRFALRVGEDVTIGDTISNRAAIYFDQNPAIITNVVRNRFVEVEEPSSTGDAAQEQAWLEVFPNPASDRLTVRTERPVRGVQLFDLGGRLLADYGPGTTEVPVANLPAGVYVLRVATDGQAVGIRRIVVR